MATGYPWRTVLASSLVFLLVFVALHTISDAVPGARLPFLTLSEAVWEHMEMGLYSAMVAYLAFASAGGRRSGVWPSLPAFSAQAVASTLSIFT